MIVVMSAKASEAQIQGVNDFLEERGLKGRRVGGEERSVIGVIGTRFEPQLGEQLEMFPGVERVTPIRNRTNWPAASSRRPTRWWTWTAFASVAASWWSWPDPALWRARPDDGDGAAVKAAGATVLRGGAYKPRTSPYAFQGMGDKGLEILNRVRAGYGPQDRLGGDGTESRRDDVRRTPISSRWAPAACRTSPFSVR